MVTNVLQIQISTAFGDFITYFKSLPLDDCYIFYTQLPLQQNDQFHVILFHHDIIYRGTLYCSKETIEKNRR